MRTTIDRIFSTIGLALAAVLLVAGGLLTWASNFIGDEVRTQLTSQHITMPGGPALTTQDMKDALGPYAGQQMTNGDQAKAYADHFIAAHMQEASEGKTYSEVSGEYLKMVSDPAADPAAVKKLGDLRQTLFMGDTLRGLLLYGYAFATIGKIAGYAAIAAFVAAALFLVLGLLGLRHAKLVATPQSLPALATTS